MIDFSVIIRTLGTADDKYKVLLNSIKNLDPPPREVIVVLPKGVEPPKERMGSETFIYCEKGMVKQRLVGINSCKTPYALVCDDDVSFGSDFVSKLHIPIKEGVGEISIAPLFTFLPIGLKQILFNAFTARAYPMMVNRDKQYIKILKSSGFSYNKRLTNKHYYLTESAPWTCFYGSISALKRIKMEEEEWLDKNGYAALDDQVMFYKANSLGIRTVVTTLTSYLHNDAKASKRSQGEYMAFCSTYNRTVFWYKFIYLKQKCLPTKVASCISFLWFYVSNSLIDIFSFCVGRIKKDEFINHFKGYGRALKDLHSQKYE